MYRSLNVETLGITGRQSELIELALSFRFKGLDICMETFARQVESRGQEYATRCLDSARNCPVGLQIGVWPLPISWDAEEDRIKEQITKIPALANVAKTIDATRCITVLPPGSNTMQMKESFDFYSEKLNEIGELLSPHGISLGVGFMGAVKAQEGLEMISVSNVEKYTALMSTVNASNVGYYIDTWNWHLGGGTTDQIVELGADKIVAISVADVPSGVELAAVELNQRLLPSTDGVIPHADLLNKLHELECDAPVTPQPNTSQYRGITRDKIVKLAAEQLRSVWPSAELLEEAEAEAEAAGEAAGGDKTQAAKGDAAKAESKEASEKNGEAKAVSTSAS